MKQNLPVNRGVPYCVRKTRLMLALLLALLFIVPSTTIASAIYAQDAVTLHIKSDKLSNVLTRLKDDFNAQILFDINSTSKVDCFDLNLSKSTIDNALAVILKDSGFGYKKVNNVYVVKEESQAMQDNKVKSREITGKVVDLKGTPLYGVTVLIKGTYVGSLTNEKGDFKISAVSDKPTTLVFSFIGLKKKEVVVGANTKTIKVVMEEDNTVLEDAVVTGIFNKPKESFTGAAVMITGDELKKAGNRDLLKSISNIDPSFMIIDNNIDGSNPNKLPSIQLRGTSTIPSVSDFQAKTRADVCTPLFILDGFEISLERMMDLNNDEIASITILKDASSTALYGSRGANGVVVITSVKPRKGRLKVNYNFGLNLEVPDLKTYNLMDAKDKLDLEYSAGLYNNSNPSEDLKLKESYAKKYADVLSGVNTNWTKVPTQTGVGQNHYLGIGGGDDAFRYSMGLSYNNIVGAMKGSIRNTVNGNVSLSYNHKYFNFSNGLSFSVNNSDDSPYGSFSNYVALNPYWDPYDEKGFAVPNFETERNALFTAKIPNPLYNAKQGSFNKAEYTNVTENMSMNFRPIPELQISISGSYSKNYSNTDHFISPNATDFVLVDGKKGRGSREQNNSRSSSWSTGATANYFKTFGKHILSLGANVEMRESSNEYTNLAVYGFVNNNMIGMSNALSYMNERPVSGNSKSRHIGFVGTANYSYGNRYYTDFSYRRDGGSSFGKESRFAPFWSIGAGWTISNEQFMKDYVPFISNLRVKWSYGVSGSMNFSPWQAMGTYQYLSSSTSNSQYQGMIGAVIRGLENKDLKWQDTYQHNLGFDFGVWENRISFAVNLYHKLTKNAITDMTLPLSNGFEKYTGNSGEILNTGMDLNLSLTLLRDDSRSMFWNVSMGTAYNKNKLLKLSQAVKDRMNELRGSQSQGLYYVFEEGNSVDAIYAVRTVGVDPTSGNLVYVYKDGTQSLDYDVNERVACGDRMPKLDARVSSSFTFKGLNIGVGFTVRSGAKQYNETFANKIENVDLTKNVDNRVKLNRWRNPGDESSFIGLGRNNHYITDRYIQKERIFSCNNINVSYNFDNDFVKRLKFDRLTVSASLSNIFYLSTIKRERGTSYPYAIQPTFGLSCAF